VRNDLGMLPRLLLAACAILVLVWVGVLVRDHYVGDSAANALLYEPHLSDTEFDRHMERIADSRFLNPSSSPVLVRTTYYLVRGQMRAAAREAERLVRAEPEQEDRGQRDRRDLPVPVDRRMQQEHRCRRDRARGRQPLAAQRSTSRRAKAADEDQEGQQADQAQLHRHLERQRVHLERVAGHGALAQPDRAEAARPDALDRVVG